MASRRRGLIVAVLACALVGVVQPAALARHRHRALVHHALEHASSSGRVVDDHASTSGRVVDSSNWSGYVETAPAASRITSVTGHWIVPSAGTLPPGMSATWAGIGGFGTSDLIQAGTTTNSVGAGQYYAWYELLPDGETPIAGCTRDAACTINPGDSVAVHIDALGPTNWRIQIDDQGHWSWSTSVFYASSESSAEWVLEVPSVVVGPTVLANVGAVTFDDGNGYRLGNLTKRISQDAPILVRLNLFGVLPASLPSALDADGDGFRACAYSARCAAPRS